MPPASTTARGIPKNQCGECRSRYRITPTQPASEIAPKKIMMILNGKNPNNPQIIRPKNAKHQKKTTDVAKSGTWNLFMRTILMGIVYNQNLKIGIMIKENYN
jgi:hypothetical protein